MAVLCDNTTARGIPCTCYDIEGQVENNTQEQETAVVEKLVAKIGEIQNGEFACTHTHSSTHTMPYTNMHTNKTSQKLMNTYLLEGCSTKDSVNYLFQSLAYKNIGKLKL